MDGDKVIFQKDYIEKTDRTPEEIDAEIAKLREEMKTMKEWPMA